MRGLVTVVACGLISASALAQTTNTNCTQIGNQVNCTSTTSDNGASAYEAGRQIGAPIGSAIGNAIARHNQVKNYCKFHPGEDWHSADWSRAGTCKAPKEKKARVAYVPAASLAPSQSTAATYSLPPWSRFTPGSDVIKEWCSEKPSGTSYVGSDGLLHPCAE
jgi:hypothetical protein